MKKIICLAVLFTSCIFPQQSNPNSFFPSSVGNVWEYSTSSGISRYEIVKDSILTDQSKFIYYAPNSSPLYRIDTNYNVYYNPTDLNWLYYKLDADSGDTWIVEETDTVNNVVLKAIVKQKSPAVVFGKPSVIMKIYYGYMPRDTIIELEGWSEYIAAGFGELKYFDESGGGPQKILVGAIIDGDTSGTITAIDDKEVNNIPSDFVLYQNYPNPFNPRTVISFQLPVFSKVSLKIYDLLGRVVATLVNEEKPAGHYKINFDASKLSSGVYLYRIIAGDYINSKKIILLK